MARFSHLAPLHDNVHLLVRERPHVRRGGAQRGDEESLEYREDFLPSLRKDRMKGAEGERAAEGRHVDVEVVEQWRNGVLDVGVGEDVALGFRRRQRNLILGERDSRLVRRAQGGAEPVGELVDGVVGDGVVVDGRRRWFDERFDDLHRERLPNERRHLEEGVDR